MSDTEEIIIPRATRKDAVATKSQLKVNTKPEIAREKLKEKRERLKKEKENMLIEEAKKRLISESEKKQQEEEKKKSDPSYALLMKMEEMMAKFQERQLPVAPSPIDEYRKPKRVSKKKVEPEPEPEPEPEQKPKRKPKQKLAAIPIAKEPKPIENVPKRKKKVIYLQQQEPIMESSTKFVGYDVAPPAEPIQYQPSQGLLSALMGRRNMNSFTF